MRRNRFLLQGVLVLAALGLSAVVLPAPAQASSGPSGPWYMWDFGNQDTSQNSDAKCIDVPHGNAVNNVQVQTYQCNGGANQRWSQWDNTKLEIVDPKDPKHQKIILSEAFWFQNANNECLTVQNNGTANSNPVILYNCASNQPYNFNAQWATVPVPDKQDWWESGKDYYWIVNVNSGKCLTVQNPAGHNGAGWLIQYDCNEGSNEIWTWDSISPA